MPHDHQLERAIPATVVKTGSTHDDPKKPEAGIALCLSGGGYRAMLFHLGALWRLSELGYLTKMKRVSSVSGGSIVAGVLGLKWAKLGFDAKGIAANFNREIVDPIRNLASKTIDEGAIVGGIFTPGSIADKVTDAYRKHLFGTATLQALPPDPPRFVINATNVQSGALFRFSRPYIADYRLGRVNNPTVELAVAVAASSAFPPVLSPLRMRLRRAGLSIAAALIGTTFATAAVPMRAEAETIPAAPTNLLVTVVDGTSLRATWTDRSNNESRFTVRAFVCGYWEGGFCIIYRHRQLTDTRSGQPQATGWRVSTLIDDLTYEGFYDLEVRAVNSAGTSGSSNFFRTCLSPATECSVVPDVVDRSAASASNVIIAAGLVPRFSNSGTRVARQSPLARAGVPRGSTVGMTMRSGNP